jgi:hypothetical protein
VSSISWAGAEAPKASSTGDICTARQLDYSNKEKRHSPDSLGAQSSILTLPPELHFQIVNYLTKSDRWALTRTNQHFRSLVGMERTGATILSEEDLAFRYKFTQHILRDNSLYITAGHLLCSICGFSQPSHDFLRQGLSEQDKEDRYDSDIDRLLLLSSSETILMNSERLKKRLDEHTLCRRCFFSILGDPLD